MNTHFTRSTVSVLLLLLTACSSAWGTPGPTGTPFQPAAPTAQATAKVPTDAPLPATMVAPTAPPLQSAGLTALYRSGQTFLTFPERTDLTGERYRLYRSAQPISAANFAQAARLAEVGKDSARFYANRYFSDDVWQTRWLERLVIADGAAPLPEGTGLFVWTPSAEDFGGQNGGTAYYAVTVTPAGGAETFSPAAVVGPLAEQVADPLPVEITHSPGIEPGPGAHIYIQYMDLRHWNPTYHAPNADNSFYGLDPQSPALPGSLVYAYDYVIFTPQAEWCGGALPDRLPVLLSLHGAKGWRYVPAHDSPYPHCAYELLPTDMADTWYFGFAQKHDYRQPGPVEAGDVIHNYTEYRVLRMIYDLLRQPPDAPQPDPQRVYVFGHSMGGSGTLGFASRYPNVFAAAYAGEPISNYRTAGITKNADWAALVAIKWGVMALNLPIAISAPGNWAAPLQKYNGLGVWDWQNYQANFAGQIPGRLADEMVPLGFDSGMRDPVLGFSTQGQPFFPLLNASKRVWSGEATDLEHDWSNFSALPPSMGLIDNNPFWNLKVIRDESVPAFSQASLNPTEPPTAPTRYNLTLKWSSSWDPWGGAPVDQPKLWQMAFCTVAERAQDCASGTPQTVTITPRRLQHFVVTPGARYDWENQALPGGRRIASGTVTADANGLVSVPKFLVTPGGNRLTLRPHR